MTHKRQGIALLITVMFVIVITVAIGFSLKQVNTASEIVKKENFLYQSSIIVEDVLTILKTSEEIKQVSEANSSSELYMLLSQAAFIPFEISDLEIILKISSARSKIKPANLDANNTALLRQYFNNYGINSQYVEILTDNLSGIKEDNSYNTRIFDEKPYLFREYIASSEHLKEINEFYTQEYNDNALKKINFENLFYFTSDKNSSSYKIDINYATTEVWELMLGTTKERAEQLALGGGSYETLEDIDLNDDERHNLNLFNPSTFEPILFVEIEIAQNKNSSKISFEYDIKNKKGSNFVYKI